MKKIQIDTTTMHKDIDTMVNIIEISQVDINNIVRIVIDIAIGQPDMRDIISIKRTDLGHWQIIIGGCQVIDIYTL